MPENRSRTINARPFALETLEGRVVLSAMVAATAQAAEVSALAVKKVPTTTTLNVSAGTLGQPITFSVTVKAAASAGAPTGTVAITDHGQLIQTLPLSPTTTTGKFAVSGDTITLKQQPGGVAYYFGQHSLVATYVPGNATLAKSSASKTFKVAQPNYATLAGGVKVATIAPGTGPAIQAGQTASVAYTGYLAKNGKIFDDTINDGGTPLTFEVGAGSVIPGFDAGTLGMQVGESRIIEIPPAQGYGKAANGPIPGNSTLIFVVTLESIS